jgi:hypothetical protein
MSAAGGSVPPAPGHRCPSPVQGIFWPVQHRSVAHVIRDTMSASVLAGRSMVEKRATPRQRVLKSGTIRFGGGAIDCTVRNLSTNGAALDVATPVGIPATFTLAIPSDGFHFACQVLWRKERRIGVKFV